MTDTDPLSHDLLVWYDAHRRDLPWRNAVEPYRTWVSEVMLQQTRVDTATPYFLRFIERYPTVDDLAAAPLDDVLSLWAGLGYYSRARNLHKGAQLVAEAGAFPSSLDGLRALPGVGEYVAAAIASIALGLDVPAVDGNVERVLCRIHRHSGTRASVAGLAGGHLPVGRAGDFNQALMDLGSAVCTPRRPGCDACPVARHCQGLAVGDQEAFPSKAPRRPPPQRRAVAGVLVRDDRVLVARRPAKGLFGGLFELPGDLVVEPDDPGTALRTLVEERLGVRIAVGPHLGTLRHVLTHMRLTLDVYRMVVLEGAEEPVAAVHYTALRWIDPSSPGRVGMSTLTRKALAIAGNPQRQGSLS